MSLLGASEKTMRKNSSSDSHLPSELLRIRGDYIGYGEAEHFLSNFSSIASSIVSEIPVMQPKPKIICLGMPRTGVSHFAIFFATLPTTFWQDDEPASSI